MSALEKLFADLPRIPSMPRVVQDLIASLCKEDVDIGSLVAQVKLDQSLSVRVLAMANSSAFGASKRIGAIDQAVTMIGLVALRSLVIASGISRAFASVEGLDMPSFWRQSMICAGVARQLGKHQGVNREFAYTAGLMARLGQIIIHLGLPDVAARLDSSAAACSKALFEQERALLGLNHCEVGAELARRWNFPSTIQNALRWCAEPLAPEAGPLAAIVNLSCVVTQGLLEGDDPEKISVLLDPAVLARLSFSRVDAQKRIEACVDLPASVEPLL
ncbi:HDOD domain-containing protein [Uliginosibacterium sp. 31-16]|uniref:HDOD domain-containing protein n=1 Tax=Uliginosibacterium sp. 31-16 TaxID=3068315 RepID=UPI00273F3578|nr:HDOD domain-containing protein [Uliginosibacterium sp. 31-16]MDP5239669.1 HDOD domain-containing protein [Uliginosibacterium sp. 31-16]